MATTGNKDLSLYFHIPFCQKKCPFCHFFVLQDKKELKTSFFSSLKKEWQLRYPLLENKNIVSIYFGGGTPSRLAPSYYKELLSLIPHKNAEITLEANPEDVTVSLIKEYKKVGINRMSIGVQSFDDKMLSLLKRVHNSRQAKKAVLDTYAAGIENISIDLMYDLPYQTLSSWKNTLDELKDLPFTHLSLYDLIIEPNTAFFRQKKSLIPHLPKEQESLAMLNLAIKSLSDLGLKRYEISAFAKDGLVSKHNTAYWTARPFIGYGPSAFSYFDNKRFKNVSNLNKYIDLLDSKKDPVDFKEALSFENRQKELLSVGLRMLSGVDLKKHAPLSKDILISLDALQRQGFVTLTEGRCKLTEKGTLFYDTVAEMII